MGSSGKAERGDVNAPVQRVPPAGNEVIAWREARSGPNAT
jgi:hypothetical protein